ncbi:hypothetical protein Ahy_B08g092641 isoform C [Arachis hypogaea]|uniref:Thymidylate kinase-like domain-containing protein n=1 Tax=Arachis hypogaea TaxID=3818 RepID=A0A444Y481_ARAHY|nr:hypothetical protein Ahy_B08g092641 isoform C [Arachis hypogaea]
MDTTAKISDISKTTTAANYACRILVCCRTQQMTRGESNENVENGVQDLAVNDSLSAGRGYDLWHVSFKALLLQKSFNFRVQFFSNCSPKKLRMDSNLNCSIEGNKKVCRGALVVLEGLDRSGKSSQCSRLANYLEGQGISAELWRFPDRNTDVGKMISAYLTNTSQLDDHTIHLLFSANRWEKRFCVSPTLSDD